MYNIMIVDDDRLVRERIISAIPLEKLGLSLCGEAEDGVQALELFERCRPQIIIMDINIPLINGLDVAKQILADDPDVNIIIVTGFGSLDFAREAIREGMVDFLLKPIDFQELEGILKKITDKLKAEAVFTLEQQRMERLLERGMPLLRSKYFLTLLQTAPENLTEESCRQYLRDFGIEDSPKEICVAIVVPNYGVIPVDEQMSMQAVFETELHKNIEVSGVGCIVVYDSLQRGIVIAFSNQKLLAFTLEERISMMRDKMRYLYHMDFRASIGIAVPGFRFLQQSYQNADRALSYWSVLGDNNIVSSNNVRNIDISVPQAPFMRYSEIMDLIVAADLDKLQTTVVSYLNDLVYSSRISIHSLQLRAIELMALMVSCARELGENIESIDEEKQLLYVGVLSSNSPQSIIRAVQTTAEKLLGKIHGEREENKSRALGGAKRYILQNYSNPDLNLAEVAEYVNLSPSYLSQLFRKIDNCTFTEHLNSVRIEQAKRLLSSTHLRVYEVANAVGYQNSKYFFQLFKQLTGKKPREFYKAFGVEPEENQV